MSNIDPKIFLFPTTLFGVLVFDSVSRVASSPPPPHTTSSHTIFHTQLCQPPSFTHNFVNHHLSHTVFHIQLCQPPSFTHNFVTHHLSRNFVNHIQPPSVTHHLSHTPSVTHHLSHTTLSTTIFHHLSHTTLSTTICHTHRLSHTTLSTTICHTRSFCVAGVALMALSGALGPAWSRVTPRHFCVAGVALGDIHLHFTWQVWHLVTSCDIHLDFTWQARHNLTATVVLRGRRGTHGNEWRAWARLVARDAAALLRGRRGTW